MSKRHSKILFGAILILVASFFFYSEMKNLKGFEKQLKIECQGSISEIYRRGNTIYFIVDGDSLNFGAVGRNLEREAFVGDSLIKEKDTKIVRLVKMKNNKIVSNESYELYTIGLL